MGRVKDDWMEAQERGWSDPEKFVCEQCVKDDFLKSEIRANVTSNNCDYCNQQSNGLIAAPTLAVINHIAEALFSNYADPSQAGLPWDEGEYIFSDGITDTEDALQSLGLECNDDLLADIVGAFINDSWYPCAQGHWSDIQEHDELRYGWQNFEEQTKHQTRYFFPRVEGSAEPGERYSPANILTAIGVIVETTGMFASISTKEVMYRVREVDPGQTLVSFDEIGPPPKRKAKAGRMNPAGISYFYAGLDESTALAEVLSRPPCRAAIGKFQSKNDLFVLELTNLPALPSVFDASKQSYRNGLLFLKHFVDAISAPIAKDGSEHIDYVPSQIVSEYFAQVYQPPQENRLSGIIYPSAVHPGGKNIVLFPSRNILVDWSDFIDLRDLGHKEFPVWPDFRVLI